MAISRARCGLYLFGNHVHLSQKFKKGWKVCNRDYLRYTVSCTRIFVEERGDCLPRSCTKGDNHDFPVVIIASPFFPVAYPFLPGKRPSTRIYSYAYG